MSLPTDHSTLDYAYQGQTYANQPAKSSVDLKTLDYAKDGQVFFANGTVPPDTVFTPATALLTITAPSTLVIAFERRFPGMRVEDQRVSQYTAHLFPNVTIQDPALIP
jgi:hypothetical protein